MLCFIPIKSVVCREKTEYKEWSLYPLKRTITGMQDEGETLYGDLMSFSDWKSLNLKFKIIQAIAIQIPLSISQVSLLIPNIP